MTLTATHNGSTAKPWIAHEVDERGPVNPVDPNLPFSSGELGRTGEIKAVDAAVTAVTTDGQRWLLLIKCRTGEWAFPGGKLEAGEDVVTGVVRELGQETGLKLPGAHWWLSDPEYVADPRNRRDLWFVTRLAHTELGLVLWLPFVEGGDDAEQATWVRALSPGQVRHDLATRYGGTLFSAHEDMIDELVA